MWKASKADSAWEDLAAAFAGRQERTANFDAFAADFFNARIRGDCTSLDSSNCDVSLKHYYIELVSH